jgi:hypothetical protein
MVRIATHHAAGVAPPIDATLRSAASAKATIGRHDYHHEQRLGVVHRVVQIVRRRGPALARGERHHQHDRPEAEHHFHFAEEVHHLGDHARQWLPSRRAGPLVGAMLEAMRQAGEPRRREGVGDGQQKDDGGDQVEGVDGNPVRERAEQAVRRGWRIGREGRREQGNGVGHGIERHSSLNDT